ncbi:MAG: tetratricopeptide repeat protein [Syntrophothermus sp.]
MIRTPDYRLRVFVSSTLKELADERDAVRRAILSLRLAPVMFELGARPHLADDLYQAYLAQSHVFIGLYWQSYGWVAPKKELSGLEDEYNLSGDLPRLLYIKSPAPDREPALTGLLDRMRDENAGCYKSFTTADELRELVESDLALLLTERFEATRGRELPEESVGEHPLTNLPFLRNPLIGREEELRTGCDLLLRDDVALATLTGPGGCGKSRLGIEIALEVRDRFADGVYLVGLDVITDPDLVVPTIARTLGVPEPTDGTTADEALRGSVCGKRLLLLLDNFEQVIAAAPRIARLLEGCPHIKMLVTSRAPLRLRAEKELPVPPLALPPVDRMLDHQPLSQYAAVQLFIERAQAARTGFEVTSENAPIVAEICHRLDGLPLAIELAAARIRMLSPRALLERMEQSFDVLGGGIRDLPERQRTLDAVIDWSHSLLGDEEKRLFRRLGAFVGGWTFEAAHSLGNADGEEPMNVFAALEGLVDLSLVVPPEETGGELRFRFLETIRKFAVQRLDESGEGELARRLHAEFFLEVAEQFARQAAERPPVREEFAAIEADVDNVRAARAWLSGRRRDVDELRLLSALRLFFYVRGYQIEAKTFLNEALTRARDVPPDVRADALTASIWLAYRAGDYAAARVFSEELLTLSAGLSDSHLRARALGELGNVAAAESDYEAATELYEEAARMFRRSGDKGRLSAVLGNLGDVALCQGRLDNAEQLLVESVAIAREGADRDGEAVALFTLARTRLERGDREAAVGTLVEAIGIGVDLGYPEVLAYCVTLAAELAAPFAPESAAELAGASEAALEGLGIPLQRLEREAHDRTLAWLGVRLGPRLEELRERGRSLELEEAASSARSLLDRWGTDSGATI